MDAPPPGLKPGAIYGSVLAGLKTRSPGLKSGAGTNTSLSTPLSGGVFLRMGSFAAILVPPLERMSALLLRFADFSIAYGLILPFCDEVRGGAVCIGAEFEVFPVLENALDEHRAQVYPVRHKTACPDRAFKRQIVPRLRRVRALDLRFFVLPE